MIFIQPRVFLNSVVRAMAMWYCLGHYANWTLKKPWVPGVSEGLLVLSELGAWWAAVQLCELLVPSLSLELCEPAHQSDNWRGRLDVRCGIRVGYKEGCPGHHRVPNAGELPARYL